MGSGCSQAYISHVNDIIKIRLSLSRPLRIEAGQYIGLWIPAVSFWSFLQTHPFTVTSWSEGEQNSLDLFIEPRGGLTQRLLYHSKTHYGGPPCLALFSGPHGISAPVSDYETVLMISSGFGIAAQLPYLTQLIYGYNACKTRTRRVHLVWQLETIGKPQIAVYKFETHNI
jgi:NAD(P)H-flavin reductase